MKKLLCLLFVISFVSATIITSHFTGAQSAPTNIISESIIFTLPKTNLNAARIRTTITQMTLNRWVQFNIEKYNSETNGVLIDRDVIWITPAELQAWCNAGNPNNFIKALLLTKIALSESP